MISDEVRRAEMNMLHGGVLVIVGILLPKMLDSYSLLRAYCYTLKCENGEVGGIVVIEMGISYAAALAVMFVFGVLSPSIRATIRKCVGESDCEGVMHPDAVPSHCDRPVSSSAEQESFDKSVGGFEPGAETSPEGLQAPPHAVDDLAVSVGSGERSVVKSMLVGSPTGSSGIALPKQLMSAAVCGLVAGTCFSVVTRLFSRH